MSDEVFWSSSIAFLCDQLDRFSEMHKQANKNTPKRKNGVEKTERTETQTFKKLSPQEIANLRAKVK